MMRQESAQILALRALAWGAEGEALPRFLTASGLDPEDLKARAHEPELLAAWLDFLLLDDGLAGAFCAQENIQPADLHRARAALPGSSR